jgi:hypothetical protein
MTNLTEKLDLLNAHLSERHDAMMGKIDERTQLVLNDMGAVKDKLDIVIAKLGDMYTAITNNGAFDTAPIVAAILAMRGDEPENTLRSINQSLWNIAGPAPGATLVELLDQLSALADAIGDRAGGTDMLQLIAEGLYTQPQAPLNLRYPYLLALKGVDLNLTLAELLEQIHIDIAGTPAAIGADYSPAVPPAGGCTGAYSDTNYMQLSGWDITSNPTRYTATFHDPVGNINLAPGLIEVADGNTYHALIITGSSGIAEFCAMWQAATAIPKSVQYRRYASGGGGVYNPILVDADLTAGAQSGSGEMFVDANAIVFFVDYGEGETPADPGINLWLKGFGAS